MERILDEWGGEGEGAHAGGEALLKEYGLSPWWAQAVTIQLNTGALAAPIRVIDIEEAP